jgi:hypothetical protein
LRNVGFIDTRRGGGGNSPLPTLRKKQQIGGRLLGEPLKKARDGEVIIVAEPHPPVDKIFSISQIIKQTVLHRLPADVRVVKVKADVPHHL